VDKLDPGKSVHDNGRRSRIYAETLRPAARYRDAQAGEMAGGEKGSGLLRRASDVHSEKVHARMLLLEFV
jgi:hypothetical protein